jgi:type IV pilus assembly protein PilN
MKIDLNLASRPFTDLRPILRMMRIAMGVVAVGVVVLGFVLRVVNNKAREASAHLQLVDTEIANMAREQQGYLSMMSRPENTQIQVETKNLNELFNQKAFSWTLVMEDLETALPAGVKVTEIEPILAKDGRITLHMRVLGPRDKGIELIQNMEHSRCFLLPRIVAESVDSQGGPNQIAEKAAYATASNFDLLADYNADSADQFPALGHAPAAAEPLADLQAPGEPTFKQRHSLDARISSSNGNQQPITGVIQ